MNTETDKPENKSPNRRLAENFLQSWFWAEKDDFSNNGSMHPIAACERPVLINALVALLDESQEEAIL